MVALLDARPATWREKIYAVFLVILFGFTQSLFSQSFPGSRDPWLWPFDSLSIWNMPIGSDATYMPAGLDFGNRTFVDEEVLAIIPAGSPFRPLYAPGSWQLRCEGMRSPTGNPNDTIFIQIPDNFIVPDAAPPQTPNNSAALLQPDGRTIVSIGPMARCDSAGPVYGWYASVDDIYGDGYFGSHGGSGLSALGGSLRLGELTGAEPIRHAIKINIWGERYMMYDSTSATPGYRWPARQTDSYANGVYGGNNPELVLGALMAIPPEMTPQDLDITQPAAEKLFYALQDYGAYIVDDAAWNVTALCAEYGVIDEFQAMYGYPMQTNDTSNVWYKDYYSLVRNLHIVTNNRVDNIGGGGVRRQPLAPPFDTPTAINQAGVEIARSFELLQNYPNPFNPQTTIAYHLAKPAKVRLLIYDVSGQLQEVLLKEKQSAGSYQLAVDMHRYASGIYFYRLTVDGVSKTRKMMLVR